MKSTSNFALILSLDLLIIGCGYFDQQENKRLTLKKAKQLVVDNTVLVNQPGNAGATVETGDANAVTIGDNALALQEFSTNVHPILTKNCGSCHGSAVSPKFADEDNVNAFVTLTSANVIDFRNPENSRIIRRLTIESHNCWSECADNGKVLTEAIRLWADKAEIKDNAVDPTIKFKTLALPLNEVPAPPAAPPAMEENDDNPPDMANTHLLNVLDGEVGTDFQVIESGNSFAAVSIKQGPSIASAESLKGLSPVRFSFKLSAQARNLNFYVETDASGQAGGAFYVKINNQDPFLFELAENNNNSWQRLRNSGGQGRGQDVRPRMNAGTHTLEFYPKTPGTRLLNVFISNQGTNPNDYQDPDNSVRLTYDLSTLEQNGSLSGAKFSIKIRELNEKSYLLSSPTIIAGSRPIKVRNIKPMINGHYLDQHATYTIVDHKDPVSSKKLNDSSLVLLKENGKETDQLSFGFESLEAISN